MSNGIMDNPGDAKYGFTTEQLFEGFRILKSKGVKSFGIHAFLASNTVTNEYYPILAKQLFEVAVRLKEETGADIRFINLSGGGNPLSAGTDRERYPCHRGRRKEGIRRSACICRDG